MSKSTANQNGVPSSVPMLASSSISCSTSSSAAAETQLRKRDETILIRSGEDISAEQFDSDSIHTFDVLDPSSSSSYHPNRRVSKRTGDRPYYEHELGEIASINAENEEDLSSSQCIPPAAKKRRMSLPMISISTCPQNIAPAVSLSSNQNFGSTTIDSSLLLVSTPLSSISSDFSPIVGMPPVSPSVERLLCSSVFVIKKFYLPSQVPYSLHYVIPPNQ